MMDTDTTNDMLSVRTKEAFEGTTAEGIAGIAAVALAIIGLSNVIPLIVASIASIAVGVALAFEGGALSARYSALFGMGEKGTGTDAPVKWSGVTTLFLAGAAGIALGILSLIGIVPMTLIPIAAIAFGSALILDSGANTRLSVLEARHSEEFKAKKGTIRETAQASAGIAVFVGIASIILGILALIGFSPLVLSLIALLSIGGASTLTGVMIGGRISSVFRGN